MQSCARNCWISGAVAGLIVLLLTRLVGGLGWGGALFFALMTCGLLGGALYWLLCQGRHAQEEGAELLAEMTITDMIMNEPRDPNDETHVVRDFSILAPPQPLRDQKTGAVPFQIGAGQAPTFVENPQKSVERAEVVNEVVVVNEGEAPQELAAWDGTTENEPATKPKKRASTDAKAVRKARKAAEKGAEKTKVKRAEKAKPAALAAKVTSDDTRGRAHTIHDDSDEGNV